MLTSLTGIYENGQITLLEQPRTPKKQKVIITFLDDVDEVPANTKLGTRPLGTMKGSFRVAPDFNDPLDDLKEYM